LSLNRSATHPTTAPAPDALPTSLDAYERCVLQRALEESGGDASATARLLGIGRSTLYRKLVKHGLLPGNRSAPGKTARLLRPRSIR
jgi:DNA-binding NtrC family response regulator